MAQGAYIRWSCAIAQHLLNRIAGHQMNEQKNQRDHQPDNRNSKREAGEGLLHGLQSTINHTSASGLKMAARWSSFQ